MNYNQLLTVFVANGLGVLLLITLFLSNKSIRLTRSKKAAGLRMAIIAILSCIADPIAYAIDGLPGVGITVLIHISNSWLYLANMLAGRAWVHFISEHLHIPTGKKHQIASDALLLAGILCLLVNLRYPIVYKVENNVYSRTYLYWLFVGIGGVNIIDSLLLYYRARRNGGMLKFFPINAFIIPVLLGIVFQSVTYGVSLVWPCVAIGVAGMVTALKNDIIFRDHLTGLYNRSYLDYLRDQIYNQKKAYFTGIMIDLNEFKRINDKFGHATGDEALITAAGIMCQTVGDLGNVIRYAGDEFVVLLNTVDEQLVEQTIARLRQAFEEANNTGEKPYRLSASMGYASLDIKNQSMNDFMNTIDYRMYEDKSKYYQKEHTEEI